MVDVDRQDIYKYVGKKKNIHLLYFPFLYLKSLQLYGAVEKKARSRTIIFTNLVNKYLPFILQQISWNKSNCWNPEDGSPDNNGGGKEKKKKKKQEKAKNKEKKKGKKTDRG